MSKYKVGDEVNIKMIVDDFDSETGFYMAIEREDMINGMWLEESKIDKCVSKTYEDGLADAWELARKIADISTTKERADIFGYCCNGITVTDVLRDFTPQQALAKIEAYEKSQQIDADLLQEINDIKQRIIELEEKYVTKN